MVFDVSAANLHLEKENAYDYVKSLLQTLVERRRRFHGPHFKGWGLEGDPDSYDPENVGYQYISLMVPRLAAAPFRVRMSTRRPAAQRNAVEALEFALNRWAIDSDYQELREEQAVDFCLGYAVQLTTLEEQPGYVEHDDPLMWPRISRISPTDFIFDPLAKSIKLARFLGHRMISDKGSLQQRAKDFPDEGWNEGLLESLGENVGVDEVVRGTEEGKGGIDRGELVYWELWVPEYQLDDEDGPDEGYHGTIFTIADTQDHGDEGEDEGKDGNISPKGVYLREPRPYYGPRWGPYSVIGAYYVPEEVAPLGPLVAVQEQIKDLNKLVRAANRNDEQYKRLVLVDSRNPRLAQQLKQEPDSFVIPVRGLDPDKVVTIELGGSTQQQHIAIERNRAITDRGLGMDDAQRGAVTGIGTATEHSLAAEAGENRVGYVIGRFNRGEEQSLKTAAYFMYHESTVILPLGAEAEEALGIAEPIFMGGIHGEGSGATFDDLGIELDNSPEGAQQQKMNMALQGFLQAMGGLAQMPYVKTRKWLKAFGTANGVPELEEMVDYEVMAQLYQTQPQEDPANEQPQLSMDLGSSGVQKRMVSPNGPAGGPAPQDSVTPGGVGSPIVPAQTSGAA